MLIGKRIKDMRLEKGMSQQELGDMIGVTKVSVCGYENGTRTPSLETFCILADIFETTSIYQLENELDKIPLFKRFRISQTISLTILFIPLIFRNWTKIQNAIKARSVKNSKNNFIKINNLFQSFSTLLSYLLNTAENTRKAILNREKYLVK